MEKEKKKRETKCIWYCFIIEHALRYLSSKTRKDYDYYFLGQVFYYLDIADIRLVFFFIFFFIFSSFLFVFIIITTMLILYIIKKKNEKLFYMM